MILSNLPVEAKDLQVILHIVVISHLWFMSSTLPWPLRYSLPHCPLPSSTYQSFFPFLSQHQCIQNPSSFSYHHSNSKPMQVNFLVMHRLYILVVVNLCFYVHKNRVYLPSFDDADYGGDDCWYSQLWPGPSHHPVGHDHLHQPEGCAGAGILVRHSVTAPRHLLPWGSGGYWAHLCPGRGRQRLAASMPKVPPPCSGAIFCNF